MKCKDFVALGVVTYVKRQNSKAVRKIYQNLLYVLDLLAYLFQLALHINNNASDFYIVCF